MLDNVFGFFEKLVLNFTWSRFTFLLSLLVFVVMGVATFEFYTGHFRLNRMEREAVILERLVDVAKKVEAVPKTEPGRAAFDRMLSQFDKSLSQPPLSLGPLPSVPRALIYNILPWALLGVLVLVTTSSGRGSAMGGLIVIATPFVAVGSNLPPFQEEWINNYAYPWGAMLLVLGGIVYVQRRRRPP